MNKKSLVAIAAAAALLFVAQAVESAPKKGDAVTVRVLRAKVMKKPKFIGPVAGSVSRGDKLTYVGKKGGWYQVEGTFNGWVHKSSVVAGSVSLSSKPGGGSGGASSDEVELAGRGFSPEVEKKYRGKNPNLDFSHVDKIENAEVDPGELEKFANDGSLLAEGGN